MSQGEIISFKDGQLDVPDFPIKGIKFKDITTLLQDAKAYKEAIDQIAKHYKKMKIDKIVSPGFSRGNPPLTFSCPSIDFPFHGTK